MTNRTTLHYLAARAALARYNGFPNTWLSFDNFNKIVQEIGATPYQYGTHKAFNHEEHIFIQQPKQNVINEWETQ